MKKLFATLEITDPNQKKKQLVIMIDTEKGTLDYNLFNSRPPRTKLIYRTSHRLYPISDLKCNSQLPMYWNNEVVTEIQTVINSGLSKITNTKLIG